MAATKFIGQVPSTGPASGTWAAGDFGVSASGQLVVCTAGGTPGTWAIVAGINGTGHFNSTAGTAPTLTNVSANVTASSVVGNDVAFTLSVTANVTGVTSGSRVCTINFANAYGNATYQVNAMCSSGQAVSVVANTKAAGSFDVIAAALINNATFKFDFMVVGNG